MSTTSFRSFKKGIVLEGAAADPSDNIEGSLFHNSSSTKIKAYVQAAVRELITADQTQTLTNKTIDADSNTISNIANSQIKAAAAIDATKIADGTVTSAEFQYLGGVTSDIQTQINGKISSSSIDTLTNKTIDGDDNTVQDLALSSLKTNLTDASKFLVRDASGVVVSNTKAVPTGDVVGNSDTQTLTNKTLSGNTATNLISGAGTLTLNTTGTITVPNATDTLVGKATTDILTNKTLQNDLVDNYLDFNHETTPSNPAAGTIRVYSKSDNSLYRLNSAGTETPIGSTIPNLTVQTKTTTYTVLTTDDIILASTSGGVWTLSLYTPVGNSGKVVRVKKTTSDFTVLTIDTPAGSISENGTTSATTTINTKDEYIDFLTDGTNWHVLNRKTETQSTSFTPGSTWTSNVTITGFWHRKGDCIFIETNVTVTGTPTTASLRISIPSGLTIDTAKLSSMAGTESILGNCYIQDAGVKKYPPGKAEYFSTTSLALYHNTAATTEAEITQASPHTFASGDNVKMITFAIPISGWKA